MRDLEELNREIRMLKDEIRELKLEIRSVKKLSVEALNEIYKIKNELQI